MREIRKVTYIDFLGIEYKEEDRMKALEQENKCLSDVAKIVMYTCDKYDADCTRVESNGVIQFCPFHCSDSRCAFIKRFGGNSYPIDWKFENNLRFENEDLVREIFD